MLKEFIKKLENLLNQYDISQQEKEDIINDYKQMIEDGIQRELSEAKIIEMIGEPEKIVKELGFRHKTVETKSYGDKIIALSPFISLIIFLILGFTKNLWHPGWMVFLLIPITAIIIELISKKNSYILTALSPFISATLFILFGYYYDIWHPTWLIFLIIPMLGILESKMRLTTLLSALSPFLSLISFVLIVYYTGDYTYSWLVFLSIILFGLLHEENKKKKYIALFSLLLSITLYVILMIQFNNYLALLSFLIFIITGIYTGHVKFEVPKEDRLFTMVVILVSFIGFIALGTLLDLWAVSWLSFFIIPMSFIIKYNKKKPFLTPLTPFVSVTILVLLGHFFDLWHISWTALLLIPIVAILENA